EADVVLVLGKRLDYRLAFGGLRLFAPTARFIQVDIHPQELGMNRPLEVAICADVRATLLAFLDTLGNASWPARPWLEHARTLREQWRRSLHELARRQEPPMHPLAVFAELERRLPRNAVYSWDGGDFCHWGRAFLPARVSGGWIRLGPLGTIGAALPNAVALKLAHPADPVVLITGDGALGFYLAELDTLVRHGLPVVVIVGNDAGWGIERELQRAASGSERTVACELRPTRYDLVMQACGGGGEHVETVAELAAALQRASQADAPYLIDVRVRGARSPFTEWQIASKKQRSPAGEAIPI
ncbi:MAG: thiamine pyrophosphate-binding protein, partial [Bryobacteraceae bacterium]